MATRRLAWVLNLDADLELAAGPGYEPRKTVRAAMKPHIAQLTASLVGDDGLLVDEASPAGSAAGARGRAFCPTPRAIAILERAGAEPEPHPPLDVLRRVNSRAFASALGTTLPGAAFVTEAAVLRRMLRTEPAISATWRVKHAFGMTGRNQRVIDPATLREPDLASVEGWMKSGNGVQIEPDVAIDTEYAMHAFIAQDGSFERGAIVMQRCDARGGWIATERVAALPAMLGDVAERLVQEIDDVAVALFEAGYFGPFGIDAYTYRDRDGALAFQPRSEINARYSMGFAVGFDRSRLP
ncbi:MAG: hypothetical protein JWM74_4498 [Myxococcaceae bacterium]|jgi:hypothetical protein|nr:hypothetical protein [Myxococcaceae bacterium]